MKKAFITGVTGQDGSYLAELLFEKDYQILGVSEVEIFKGSSEIYDKINIRKLDIRDKSGVREILEEFKPDEVYNLAAQSHVGNSFKDPEGTMMINFRGLENILESCRDLDLRPRIFQASSAEIFKNRRGNPLNEQSPLEANNPYAESKLAAHNLIIKFRERGYFACNGILFNHESPLRGENFVTRKITKGLARISLGLQDQLGLGNLDVSRDWGHARDYVGAMWLMLQQNRPKEYVIGTGEVHSLRDFLQGASVAAGLNILSNGLKGVEEIYFDKSGVKRVVVDTNYFRKCETYARVANISRIKKELGWSPKISFYRLVEEMVKADLEKECL